MKPFSLSTTLLSLIAVMTLSACGRSDDLYTVNLITGLERLNPARNLMDGLIHQKVAVDPSCGQPNLFAGTKIGPNSVDLVSRRTGMVVSNTTGTHLAPITATWLGQNSSFPPIQFKVPAGFQEFGVVGAIVQPTPSGVDAAGNCASVISGTIQPSFSVLGHRAINVDSNMDIPLNVWMTAVGTAPSTTSPAAGVNCVPTIGNGGTSEDENLHQVCPNKNFKAAICIGAGGTSCHTNLMANYVYSAINNNTAEQYIQSTSLVAPFYMPDIDPIRFIAVNNGVPTGFPAFFGDNKSGMNLQQAISFGFISVAHNGMIPIVLTQQGTGIDDVTINFGAVPGVSTYDIKIANGANSPGDSPSFQTIAASQSAGSYNASNISVPTIVAGSFYTISISAAGSSTQSTWAWYRPVDPITSTPTLTVSSAGIVTASVPANTYPPTGSVFVELQLTTGGGQVFNSAPLDVTSGVQNGGNMEWTFNVTSATYTSGKVRVFNHAGGSSTQTWTGSISP